MSRYAKILNGEVKQIIQADEDFMKTFVDSSPGTWVPVKDDQNPSIDGGLYDAELNLFSPLRQYQSHTWDKSKNEWVPPVECPPLSDLKEGERYEWNEDKKDWDVLSRT
tara:strand:- start:2389 stop:2715 length:327 start_codon:yes stop_codon:yes gene_type:complete